jgi:hypothetical protein
LAGDRVARDADLLGELGLRQSELSSDSPKLGGRHDLDDT